MSGRAIATRPAKYNHGIFQPLSTRPCLGGRLRRTRCRDRIFWINFQPAHVWEGDCDLIGSHLNPAKCPFNPPMSGRAIATRKRSRSVKVMLTFNPPMSGRAIATRPPVRLSVARLIFQPAHVWEGDCDPCKTIQSISS